MKKRVILAIAAAAVLTSCGNYDSIPTAQSINSLNKPVIVIDAGHGGADGGGVSVGGVPEKGMNLDIATGLCDMMRIMGYEVIMTRTEDISIHDEGVEGLKEQKLSDMKNRLELFNTPDAVCISVHQNRFTDPKYSGAQMFYYKENAEAARLAESLRARIRGNLQPDNERETKAMDDELYLLCNCDNPAVMSECGFISNPQEAALLEQEPYRRQVAFTLMCGLHDFHIETGRISEKNQANRR